MFSRTSNNKMISMFLVFSLFVTFFAVPTPARAGMLGSLLSNLRPYTRVLGKIGGAVVGAAFCGASLPPLGLIAGAIVGWIAGGIITGYATSSLTHLATLAGAAGGAMALASFGPVGYVAGILGGAFLAKKAMGLLYEADGATTGGVVFSRMPTGEGAAAPTAPSITNKTVTYSQAPAAPVTAIANKSTAVASKISLTDKIREADKKYQKAYKDYVAATKLNVASKIEAANKAYRSAYEAYKKLTGKEPAKY